MIAGLEPKVSKKLSGLGLDYNTGRNELVFAKKESEFATGVSLLLC